MPAAWAITELAAGPTSERKNQRERGRQTSLPRHKPAGKPSARSSTTDEDNRGRNRSRRRARSRSENEDDDDDDDDNRGRHRRQDGHTDTDRNRHYRGSQRSRVRAASPPRYDHHNRDDEYRGSVYSNSSAKVLANSSRRRDPDVPGKTKTSYPPRQPSVARSSRGRSCRWRSRDRSMSGSSSSTTDRRTSRSTGRGPTSRVSASSSRTSQYRSRHVASDRKGNRRGDRATSRRRPRSRFRSRSRSESRSRSRSRTAAAHRHPSWRSERHHRARSGDSKWRRSPSRRSPSHQSPFCRSPSRPRTGSDGKYENRRQPTSRGKPEYGRRSDYRRESLDDHDYQLLAQLRRLGIFDHVRDVRFHRDDRYDRQDHGRQPHYDGCSHTSSLSTRSNTGSNASTNASTNTRSDTRSQRTVLYPNPLLHVRDEGYDPVAYQRQTTPAQTTPASPLPQTQPQPQLYPPRPKVDFPVPPPAFESLAPSHNRSLVAQLQPPAIQPCVFSHESDKTSTSGEKRYPAYDSITTKSEQQRQLTPADSVSNGSGARYRGGDAVDNEDEDEDDTRSRHKSAHRRPRRQGKKSKPSSSLTDFPFLSSSSSPSSSSPSSTASSSSSSPSSASSSSSLSSLISSHWRDAGRNALRAATMAVLTSPSAPGSSWLGAKGAQVATAALGAAVVDTYIRRQHPTIVEGVRHMAARQTAEFVINNVVTKPLLQRAEQRKTRPSAAGDNKHAKTKS
ncbi:hypothetical protein SPI_00536 [Niveomyces insectorum RCEF 264]|uniref:Uncharacterized protein n=1 Tax=Niveomyces insectorum RCEF 264 TaxID=1081102 RepID=A0A168A777_9HYPO|nr:hypothetical protein SPI_00536 [Niveomyces insectorum RCEF 264]